MLDPEDALWLGSWLGQQPSWDPDPEASELGSEIRALATGRQLGLGSPQYLSDFCSHPSVCLQHPVTQILPVCRPPLQTPIF